ncbi:MAG: aspartate kinase, partial [Proteobacteria bacterium]
SDLTAIALTHALKADRCQIYKDVDGVCSADPRLVPKAKLLKTMSWETLSLLTWYGSGVVHNRGVHLAMKFKIPLEIRSSFNLETHGTLIGSAKPVEKAIVHALTHRKDLAWLRVDADEAKKIPELLSYLYSQGEYPMFVQQSVEGDKKGIELVIGSSVLPKFERHLRESGAPLTVLRTGIKCITAVGDGFWQEPEVIQRALDSLGQPTLLFDCKNNMLNMFIHDGNLEEIIGRLHQALVEV